MSRSAGSLAWLLAWTVPLWSVPATVMACPVCFSAKDEANRVAFFVSTVFLTALPLILLGAFISWVARRARRLDNEWMAERDDAGGVEPHGTAVRIPSAGGRVIPLAPRSER